MEQLNIISTYNKGIRKIISMMKELNRGLVSQVNDLNEKIKALSEDNLRLLARVEDLESKSKKTAKIVVSHHQLIITKIHLIAVKRLVNQQVDNMDML